MKTGFLYPALRRSREDFELVDAHTLDRRSLNCIKRLPPAWF
jgi:hypothetical protein